MTVLAKQQHRVKHRGAVCLLHRKKGNTVEGAWTRNINTINRAKVLIALTDVLRAEVTLVREK